MEFNVHFTSCFHSLLKLVTLSFNVLNVTKNSIMFLVDFNENLVDFNEKNRN